MAVSCWVSDFLVSIVCCALGILSGFYEFRRSVRTPVFSEADPMPFGNIRTQDHVVRQRDDVSVLMHVFIADEQISGFGIIFLPGLKI